MLGTNADGMSWIRERVNEATIQPGLLIEAREGMQWL
jgi:hypothetical protein